MAAIFTDRTTNYDGVASPAVGTGIVRVVFSPGIDTYSRLYIMHRPNGSSAAYEPKKFPTNEGKPFLEVGDSFKWDATGLQYYYKWEINTQRAAGRLADGSTVSASLTEV